MSAFETARIMSVGIVAYIQNCLWHSVYMFENGFSMSTGPRTQAPRNLTRIYSHGGAGKDRPPSQPLCWVSQVGIPAPAFNRRNTYIDARANGACNIFPGLVEIAKAKSVVVVDLPGATKRV